MNGSLIWFDMEMTGLNVEIERPIEVACIITDFDFKELASYEAVIRQPQEFLDRMDDWNMTHHTESGLAAKVPKGKDPAVVEKDLVDMVQWYFPKGRDGAVLAGNSIMQDRLFIDRYMKNFASCLHYRMLDVTSWKIIFKDKFKREHKKKNQHRALDDVRESIEELKFYLQFIDTEKLQPKIEPKP